MTEPPELIPSLRIAVDARPLCHPGTGIYRYTLELLKRMCPMGAQWFLYSPRPYDTRVLDFPNVTHRCCHLPAFPGIGQLGLLLFSRWARQDAVSVFWSPRHHLPFSLPRSIRAVVSIHDLVWMRWPQTMPAASRYIESRLMPAALSRADDVLALSAFTAGELSDYYPESASKVKVLPPASYLPVLSSIRSPQHPRSYFLFVGTMEPRKNLTAVLAAYRHYFDRCPSPLGLKLVGGKGWGGVRPVELVKEYGLQGRIEVCGNVDENRLRELYVNAHSLLMPSFYEGFGLPVIEALSQGVPVITSKDSAMAEAVGSAGLLVDPGNEGELVDAMIRLSEQGDLYHGLEALTLEQCLRYDWGRSSEDLYGLLTARG